MKNILMVFCLAFIPTLALADAMQDAKIDQATNDFYKMAGYEAVSIAALVGDIKATSSNTNKLWEETARLKRIGGIAVHSKRFKAIEAELAAKSAIKKGLTKLFRNPVTGAFGLVGASSGSLPVIATGLNVGRLKLELLEKEATSALVPVPEGIKEIR